MAREVELQLLQYLLKGDSVESILNNYYGKKAYS